MKKILFTLMSLFAIATSAHAMSYEQARNEALFLTDKMAYELNLTDAQYEAAYEINLDYLMSVSNRDNVFGPYWERRNLDIQYVLYSWQWEAFCAATYFYRPLFWDAGCWHFGVYVRYPHRDYFYFGRPHCYVSYRGGHSWRMNGGHSYYKVHCATYRPHITRGRHIGMRDEWNRGSCRSEQRGFSSTRVTGSFRNDRGSARENSHVNTHVNTSNNRTNGRFGQSQRSNQLSESRVSRDVNPRSVIDSRSTAMSSLHSGNSSSLTGCGSVSRSGSSVSRSGSSVSRSISGSVGRSSSSVTRSSSASRSSSSASRGHGTRSAGR